MLKLLAVVCFVVPFVALSCSASQNCTFEFSNNNKTCAKLQANISFDFYYINSTNKNVSVKGVDISCHNDSNFKLLTSSCGVVKGDLNYTKMEYEWGKHNNTIEFEFVADYHNSQWNMSNVMVTVSEDFVKAMFKNSSINETVEGNLDGSSIVTSYLDYQRSFQCKAEQTFPMKTDNRNVTIDIKIAQLKLQAFQFKTNSIFGNMYQCDADIKGSKIVPIAVGAALAGLVIIVLIAYVIGRIRSRRQSSYEALS